MALTVFSPSKREIIYKAKTLTNCCNSWAFVIEVFAADLPHSPGINLLEECSEKSRVSYFRQYSQRLHFFIVWLYASQGCMLWWSHRAPCKEACCINNTSLKVLQAALHITIFSSNCPIYAINPPNINASQFKKCNFLLLMRVIQALGMHTMGLI